MTRAITVRLDEADHAALERQAEHLRIRPGTLARILVHAGLVSQDASVVGREHARAALDRLARRSTRASADAVGLVAEARTSLDPNR